jgi:hypothetical protein
MKFRQKDVNERMDPSACIYIESRYNLQEASKDYMWQFSSKSLTGIVRKIKRQCCMISHCEASLGII